MRRFDEWRNRACRNDHVQQVPYMCRREVLQGHEEPRGGFQYLRGKGSRARRLYYVRWMSWGQYRICSRRNEEERGDRHPSSHGHACGLSTVHADRLLPTVHRGAIWHPCGCRNSPHPSEVLQDPCRFGFLEFPHVEGAHPAHTYYRGNPPGIRLGVCGSGRMMENARNQDRGALGCGNWKVKTI